MASKPPAPETDDDALDSDSLGFGDLGLPPKVLSAIDDLGFDTPTPIQRKAIPLLVQGIDLIGKAETGTGKTLAFTAPILAQIDTERVATQALVLCPTRELAQQVQEVAEKLGSHLGVRTALLVGGVHQGTQIFRLRAGAHIVVGTPGRVLEMLQEGFLNLGWVHHAVLDEADRMLDMGFIADVTAILEAVPSERRQVMLFSATVPPKLQSLMKSFMRNPKTVSTVQGQATVPQIRQRYVRVHPYDKEQYLCELLQEDPDKTCIVFCNTRRAVKELDRTLWGMGYPAGSIHGDQEQEQRFKVLDAFKDRAVTTLVATDVAARGLDIESVGRVINYDVPDEVETYIHRIGRTGRAGGVGEAIMLVTRYDERTFDGIRAIPNVELEEIEWQGTGRRGGGSHIGPGRHQRGGDRSRGGGGRGRSDRGRSDRSGSDRGRSDRSRSDRGRSDRDRGRDGRGDSSRPSRSRDDRPRSDDRPRDDRPRSDDSRRESSRRDGSPSRETRRADSPRSDSKPAEPRRSESRPPERQREDRRSTESPSRSKRSRSPRRRPAERSTERRGGDGQRRRQSGGNERTGRNFDEPHPSDHDPL